MKLLKYIEKFHLNVIREHKRYNTPFYYEPGVLYQYVNYSNGFERNFSYDEKKFYYKIVNALYFEGEISTVILRCVNNPEYTAEVLIDVRWLHVDFERVDESIEPKGMKIPEFK